MKDLKIKNQVMEEKIKNLTKDLKFLKDLFLAQAQTKAEKLTNAELRRLLAGSLFKYSFIIFETSIICFVR